MIIFAIGPETDNKRKAIIKLSKALELEVYEDYIFKSSSIKDLKPGIYTSTTLQHQQAKKMRPDLLISTFDEPKVHKAARFYKVVGQTGEIVKDEKGNFYDRLPKLTALKISNRNSNWRVQEYEI